MSGKNSTKSKHANINPTTKTHTGFLALPMAILPLRHQVSAEAASLIKYWPLCRFA
jgi:hypothetical protein